MMTRVSRTTVPPHPIEQLAQTHVDRKGSRQKMPALEYVLCATVFTKEPFGIGVGESMVDPVLIAVSLYGVLFAVKSSFAANVAAFWSVLLAISYLLCTAYSYPTDIWLRQGVPAAVIYTGIAALLERTSPASLLSAYRCICFVAAAFGVFQVSMSFAGVLIYIKAPGHLDSLAYEPSHYAIAVAPAVYLCFRDLLSRPKMADIRLLVVPFSVLLTVSLTGLLVLVFAASLAISRRGSALAVAFSLVLVLYGILNSGVLPERIQERVDASQKVMVEGQAIKDVQNLSVFSPLSNWKVAVATLGQGRLLGNGIGGHVHAYREYYVEDAFSMDYRYGVNAVGAHSLFIRFFSELGVLGVIGYIWWIVRGTTPYSRTHQVWWTLSAIYFAARVIKLGGFFELGMPLFALAPLCYYGLSRAKPKLLRALPRRSV